MLYTAHEFQERVIATLAARPGHALVWGVSPVTIYLLAELQRLGLEQHVAGVVDHRPGQCGRRIAQWKVRAPDAAAWAVDHLIVGLDAEKEAVLQHFSRISDATPEILSYGTAHLDFSDQRLTRLVRNAYARPHANGYPHMLIHLYQAPCYICDRPVRGDVAEFGAYEGGTTTFMAECLRLLGSDVRIFGFDTFQSFPPRRSVLDTTTILEDKFPGLDDAVRAPCGRCGLGALRPL